MQRIGGDEWFESLTQLLSVLRIALIPTKGIKLWLTSAACMIGKRRKSHRVDRRLRLVNRQLDRLLLLVNRFTRIRIEVVEFRSPRIGTDRDRRRKTELADI